MNETQAQPGAIGAGFPERLVAILIDWVILLIPNLILMYLLPDVLQYLIGLAIGVGYVVYFWTTTGSTPGKMVMGLKVVDAETGNLLDPGTAVLRYVGYLVSGLPLLLGYLWVIWDPRHQGWHDKIAKTLVVKAK